MKNSDKPEVRISETMRPESDSSTGRLVLHDALGCWDDVSGTITIRRDQLASLSTYSAVLLHEADTRLIRSY